MSLISVVFQGSRSPVLLLNPMYVFYDMAFFILILTSSHLQPVQSPLNGLSAAKIMNMLGVQGNLISAYRGKELVLGIDHVC